MATAATASAWELAWSTTTVRQFGKALSWVGGLLLVGALLYVVESRVLRTQQQFIENPAEIMMRAFAMAHFSIGWLFLFTSPRIRNGRALARVGISAAMGVGLCLFFAYFDSLRNPWLLLFFYAYFVVHEIRDETHLYQCYGDAPLKNGEGAQVLAWFGRIACLVLMTSVAFVYLAYLYLTGKTTALDRLHPLVLPAGLVSLLALLLLMSWRAARVGCRICGDLESLLSTHAPLLIVYVGLLLLLLVGAPFGSTGLNLIILMHVAAWLVFVQYQLRKHQVREGRGAWHWLRRTPTGFIVLHVGIMVLALGMMAIRVHLWQRVGFVSEMFSSKAFCYWSLMHITMAFGSPR